MGLPALWWHPRRSDGSGHAQRGRGSKAMERRHGWLFPLMVVAAGAVIALSSVGIGAILGYLPGLRGNPELVADSSTSSDREDTAEEAPAGMIAQVDAVMPPVPLKAIKPPPSAATQH